MKLALFAARVSADFGHPCLGAMEPYSAYAAVQFGEFDEPFTRDPEFARLATAEDWRTLLDWPSFAEGGYRIDLVPEAEIDALLAARLVG